LPEHLPDDAAVLLDVYACALHGVNRLPIKPGDRVVVIGTGAMAIAFAELSYLTGASAVAMIGRHTSAIERAANLVQAMPVSSAECDPVQAIKDWTQGRGADIVFECAGGIEQTLETAMEMASQGGSIGVEGVHTRPQTINSVNALLRELTITWFYSHGRRGEKTEYELALDLMAKQKIKPERLITHHFPLDRIQEAFFTADDHIQTGSIKVIINP
jgi:2-desacetyl-2-hydroxyethyl bacteriochlorophyllide A dehydrogenase